MKHLFLYAIACFFLCTACFEKEEEIKVEEEIEVAPPKVDILKCERIQQFIIGVQNGESKEPRATVKKYVKGNEYIFEAFTGGTDREGTAPKSITGYVRSNCDFICSNAFGVAGGQFCSQNFLDSLVYVETVWVDKR